MTSNVSSAPATSGMTVVVHWNHIASLQVNFPTLIVILICPLLYLEFEWICFVYVLRWECLLFGHTWYERWQWNVMLAIMLLRLLLIPCGMFQFKNTAFPPSCGSLARIVTAHGLKLKCHRSSIHSYYHITNSSQPAGSNEFGVYLSVKVLNIFAMVHLQKMYSVNKENDKKTSVSA